MLVEAALWRPDGPPGAVASVGAAWLRCFTADDPGYGFVEPEIPESAMATVRHGRGQGIGGCLPQALIEAARRTAISTLSLSVESDNNARRLYERCGFATVGQTGGSLTMLLRI